MSAEQVAYRAYLLRLWPVNAGGRRTWRASLQSVETGERRGFEDLEALLAFLKAEVVEQWATENGSKGALEQGGRGARKLGSTGAAEHGGLEARQAANEPPECEPR